MKGFKKWKKLSRLSHTMLIWVSTYSLIPWSENTLKRILHASIVLLLFIWKHVSIIVLSGIIFSSIKTYSIKKLLKLWSEILAASSLHRSTISALWSNFRSDLKSLLLIPATSKIGASFSRCFRWIAWTNPPCSAHRSPYTWCRRKSARWAFRSTARPRSGRW